MKYAPLIFKQKVESYDLPVVVQKERGGFFAFSPSWPDCYAQGDTLEEVLNEINCVALGLIELYQEENLSLPLKQKVPFIKIKRAARFNLPLYVTR